jgi:hypothetical protein
MHSFLFAAGKGWLAGSRPVGTVLDEWIGDDQENLHIKSYT